MAKKAKNRLSAENLIKCICDVFTHITDKTTTIKPKIPLVHYLMSGFALFKLKYPSLLQFDKDRLDPVQGHNLKKLFHITQVPSDTSLRERLDQLSPKTLALRVFAWNHRLMLDTMRLTAWLQVLPWYDSTQRRVEPNYLDGHTNDKFRAFHTNLSKVTKQVWRFLKECMLKKSQQKLYENQLRPVMIAYL